MAEQPVGGLVGWVGARWPPTLQVWAAGRTLQLARPSPILARRHGSPRRRGDLKKPPTGSPASQPVSLPDFAAS